MNQALLHFCLYVPYSQSQRHSVRTLRFNPQLFFFVLAESFASGGAQRRAVSAEVQQREPDAAQVEGGEVVAHEAGGAENGVDGRTLGGEGAEGRQCAEGRLRQEQTDQTHAQVFDVGKASEQVSENSAETLFLLGCVSRMCRNYVSAVCSQCYR